MKTEIIIMLTHNDVTVSNAAEIFESCKDLPIKFWGFKDVGLPAEEMAALNRAMKEAGKTTFLEVVTYTEEGCVEGAKLARDCGFDYLTGTVFFPSVLEVIKDTPIQYFPFCGTVGGSPVTLTGTVEEIAADAQRLMDAGVAGVDLTAYRLAEGDPVALTRAVAAVAGKENTIIAGSIGSAERVHLMDEINPFAYTMGSALFDKKFVKDGSFRDNLNELIRLRSEKA